MNTYGSLLSCSGETELIGEIKLWRRAKQGQQGPSELLEICDGDMYPNVKKLLQILAVLPVTTATNEHSFSSLRLIKTYLRSTMSGGRWNGLASLFINRTIVPTAEEVLNSFAEKTRKLQLI